MHTRDLERPDRGEGRRSRSIVAPGRSVRLRQWLDADPLLVLAARFPAASLAAALTAGRLPRAPAAAAHHAAFAARFAGLLGVELVRGALLVRGLSSLRGDLALPFGIHTRKTTPAAFALLAGVRHD